MYHGDKVLMSDVLVDPENSLIHQSIKSSLGVFPVNGDGFGLGWYSDLHSEPGLFKDPLPAWNNKNLISLAQHVKSKNFMAHVRASTSAPTSNVNCHPFRFENNLFMHNGSIGYFDDIRCELERLIDKKYFKSRYGSTDSEAFFLLAMTNGLSKHPKKAMLKTVEQIFSIQTKNGLDEKLKASVAYSDGISSIALKISTIKDQPSLYYICYNDLLESVGMKQHSKFNNSFIVLSEPVTQSDLYKNIDNYSSITITKNEFKLARI
jgi:glutamine amidotransferase